MSDRRINKGFVRARTPDPLSLEAFIGWLEKQPAEKTYNWACPDNCAIGQYNRFLGLPQPGSYKSTAEALGMHSMPCVGIVGFSPHTFGAALERARALSASMKSDAA